MCKMDRIISHDERIYGIKIEILYLAALCVRSRCLSGSFLGCSASCGARNQQTRVVFPIAYNTLPTSSDKVVCSTLF